MSVNPFKITMLCVSSNKSDRTRIQDSLSTYPFEVNFIQASSIREVETKVKGAIRPDVVLSDYEVEDGTVVNLIAMCDEVPVITSLEKATTSDIVTSMKSGAFDYVIKDKNQHYLQILPYIIEKAVKKKQVLDNERLLSKVVTNIRDSVLIIDERDTVVFVNPAFTETYGYTPEEITGKSINVLLPEGARTSAQWDVRQGVEQVHLKKDGTPMVISEAVSDLSMHHGLNTYRIIVCRDVTDRVDIERSLAKTAVRLDAVLSSIDDVVYSMDSKTREVFYVNKATEVVFDMSEDEFRQNTVSWKKMVHGGDLFKLEVASSDLYKNGYAEVEYRLITPKGDIKWLRDRAWIVRDGTSSRIDGIITDISKRKFAEQAYRDSEERYRTAIQSSVEAIYMMNPANLAIKDVNQAFCNLLGYTREEALQLKITDFVDQKPDKLVRYIESIIEDGQSILDKRVWKTRGGRKITVEITANKIVQRDQEIIFVVARDITAQHEIKQQLENERELLREVVTNAPIPMAILDHELRFIVFSRTWLQAYGPRRSNLQGKRLFDVYPRLPHEWEVLCQRGIDGEALHIAEYELKVNEDIVYLRLAIHPWGTSGGGRHGIILVAERIDELVSARKEAENANKAKSGFLARITHELRTPLNAILGYSQIMSNDTDLSTVHRGYVENMYRSGNHLLNMINDILDISKIEASRLELQHEPADLHEIIQDVIEMFRLKASAKGIDLHVQIDPSIYPSVKLDRSKFSQVLINLLGNAVKFTDKGKVSITFSNDTTNAYTTSEQLLTVEVEDTGRGIPAEEVHLVFEPFQQASNTDIQGTGLGLAITKRIVNLMGGDISVDSMLGQGSTFAFTVPVAINKDQIERQIDQFAHVASIKSPKPLNILVVDDVELNRTVARLLLERVGATIMEARDGQEAVDLAAEHSFHAIVMDIIMPVMDGVKAMKTIRKTSKGAKIPIIALTASGFDDKRDALLEAGFDEYILKPFKEAELLRALCIHAGVQFNFKNKTVSKAIETPAEDASSVATRLILALPDDLRTELSEYIAVQDVDAISNLIESKLITEEHAQLKEILLKVTSEYDLFFMSNVTNRLSDQRG